MATKRTTRLQGMAALHLTQASPVTRCYTQVTEAAMEALKGKKSYIVLIVALVASIVLPLAGVESDVVLTVVTPLFALAGIALRHGMPPGDPRDGSHQAPR